mmetsp:Transcript_9718/g.29557  ORF Transcript_9718/g.29557 Transcript_9718/m.29557 type:complete len:104 (+) Transcript_9718:131-442(+)
MARANVVRRWAHVKARAPTDIVLLGPPGVGKVSEVFSRGGKAAAASASIAQAACWQELRRFAVPEKAGLNLVLPTCAGKGDVRKAPVGVVGLGAPVQWRPHSR